MQVSYFTITFDSGTYTLKYDPATFEFMDCNKLMTWNINHEDGATLSPFKAKVGSAAFLIYIMVGSTDENCAASSISISPTVNGVSMDLTGTISVTTEAEISETTFTVSALNEASATIATSTFKLEIYDCINVAATL